MSKKNIGKVVLVLVLFLIAKVSFAYANFNSYEAIARREIGKALIDKGVSTVVLAEIILTPQPSVTLPPEIIFSFKYQQGGPIFEALKCRGQVLVDPEEKYAKVTDSVCLGFW